MKVQKHSFYDIVVIGGGPAGSTLSTLLVRKGYSVLLLEREKFPRFHVGESLLPATQLIWEKLGIAEPMQHFGNTFKYGGEIRIGLDPSKSDCEASAIRFNHLPTSMLQDRPYAYQVERSQFDHFLLNHARENGVTVYEETVVKEIIWEGDKATGVRWKTKDGVEYVTKAGCVSDCSGRHAFIARERKFLVPDKTIKTSAVFGHFKHVTRENGLRQGFIHTYFFENGWIWFIPLHSDIMSVGVVVNEPGTDWWSKHSPEQILLTYINRYKCFRDRFEQAEQISKIRILRGLPYSSSRSVGDGWILVGDANFFVDPLFSSGVHVAFNTADKAAEAIHGFLQGNRNMQPFMRYEKWSRNYQFHIFTTMSLLYKMLKYRVAIEGWIRLTGKGNWDSPIERRLLTWLSGYFDKFYWALYGAWCLCFLGIQIGVVREKLLGIPGWDTHTEFCLEPPLTIPKSAEFLENGNAAKSDPSTTPVNDMNYPEHWIVPSDSLGENLPPRIHEPKLVG
ncbi:MAG: NAD(P)/FAD-dependent oxidoreductase [Brasilonema sp.]